MNKYPIISTLPKLNSGPETILPFIFDLEIEQIKLLLANASDFPVPDNNEEWEDFNIADWLRPHLERMGFPSDPSQHEQPYQAARAFPFTLISIDLNDQHELDLNRAFFVLWANKFRTLSEQFYSRHQIEEIRRVGLLLVYYYGSDNPLNRKLEVEQVNEWSAWLKHTHGCYCPQSGKLVKPDLSALREYKSKTRCSI